MTLEERVEQIAQESGRRVYSFSSRGSGLWVAWFFERVEANSHLTRHTPACETLAESLEAVLAVPASDFMPAQAPAKRPRDSPRGAAVTSGTLFNLI